MKGISMREDEARSGVVGNSNLWCAWYVPYISVACGKN